MTKLSEKAAAQGPSGGREVIAAGDAPQREMSPLQSLGAMFDSEAFSPKIAASLDGTGISPERFKRAALALLSRPESSYLVEKCSRGSIVAAVMNAAACGLELHPVLGQAYIIPRGNTAQLQVGYKGYIALAARAGLAVEADVIYAGDRYEVKKGTSPDVSVYPELDPAKRGEWIAAYVITHYASGARVLTFMSRAEIEALRDKHSDAYKRGGKGAEVWKSHPEEMAKKTVIRRASKLWPISVPGGSGDDNESDTDPDMRDITPSSPAPVRRQQGGGNLDALAANM